MNQGYLSMHTRLDICIPAYNEEEIIEETINVFLKSLQSLVCDWKLIVVDNASTDKTAEIIQAQCVQHSRLVYVFEPVRGKGAAVIQVACRSDADYFMYIDADLSIQPEMILVGLETLHTTGSDIVIASRLHKQARTDRSYVRTWSSKLFNYAQKALLGITVHDTQCGLKIMNTKGLTTLQHVEERGWFFDLEFLLRAQKQGLAVCEFPIVWEEKHYPKRSSKLSMVWGSVEAIIAMMRIRAKVCSQQDSNLRPTA